jgi:hypothetical protein
LQDGYAIVQEFVDGGEDGGCPRVTTRGPSVRGRVYERVMAAAFSGGLAQWNDSDGTGYESAVALGAIPADVPFTAAKWVFWTDNQLGAGLYAAP